MNFDHVINRSIIRDNDTIRSYDIILFVKTNCGFSQKIYQECLAQNIIGSLKIVNIDIQSGKKILIDLLGHEPLVFPVAYSMFSKKFAYGQKPLVNIINELIIPIYSNI